MRRWDLMHYVFTISVAAASLAGCGGTQPPIGAPGAMPQGRHASGSSYKVVYNFTGGSDGAQPYAGLIDVNGTLYGTTSQGGGSGCATTITSGCGTVFSITPSGQETVLHAFTGGSDGANPKAALIDVNGTLYGTTFHGGDTKCKGCGTVFSITPSGVEKVLHSFSGPPDGAWPAAALINVNGTLYGTTAEGGTSGGCRLGLPKRGCGTVYSISPSGSENVLFRLVGPATGSYPAASLIDVNGTLYGTTENGGGGHGPGTVYTVTPSGLGKLLYHFTYKELVGFAPAAALIDVKGLLYGTLSSGSGRGKKKDRGGPGTVVSITTSGTVKVVYNFGFTDGASPSASLINVRGTLYGTTTAGGVRGCFSPNSYGCGTVFSVTRGGTEKVLHSFSYGGSDGYFPASNLINVNGTLYGTTAYGGTRGYGYGTVYAITP
ncbi:MAG: choice-of-anchor tandem repeat GloVer-containing protein [Candidatus Cybelea sp.]|jgi:uncharacterized repeat protein (TIGR03803 family)